MSYLIMHAKLVVIALLMLILAACDGRLAALTSTQEQGELAATNVSEQIQSRQPNFLVIVADDLGYSDLGAFGGEINTPNLDALAFAGMRFSSFYAASMCSPSRAMLLSGTDHHIAGIGNMAELMTENQRGQPGYEGYLNERVITVATRLQNAGYHTYMSGKWHLGLEDDQAPAKRGFERSFVLLEGGAHHFDDTKAHEANPSRSDRGAATYREDGELTNYPAGRYSSDFYTDKLLGYLKQKTDHKPFFAYLSFTAPHWPLQAPQDLVNKYRGAYDEGWDALLATRLARLEELGIIASSEYSLVPPVDYQAWNSLSAVEQKIEARKMEVYAAMVESLDINTGRVIEYLRDSGELDNTIVVFLSDNGPEGHRLDQTPMFADYVATFDNGLDNIGKVESFAFLGPNWAYATTAGNRMYKGFTSEGGIRVPAFVWHQGLGDRGVIDSQLLTVMDIAPTLQELAGANGASQNEQDTVVEEMIGHSFAPLLKNSDAKIHTSEHIFAWELFGRRAVRKGDWKLLFQQTPYGSGDWQLFNLGVDPGEANDVAADYPGLVEELKEQWQNYADSVGVILPDREIPY